MYNNIKLTGNNGIKISGEKIVYIDPYDLKTEEKDADYIFCTHSHYDHFSKTDINKILKDSTKIITVESSKEDAINIVGEANVLIVKPNEEYSIDNIKFKTTYAYNKNKEFHPKCNNWVGFLINFEGVFYFVAGDTDNIPEINNLTCDVAFLPVGGKYTMDYKEAATLANTLNAKLFIPTHYGSVAGDIKDGNRFKELMKNKEVKVLL